MPSRKRFKRAQLPLINAHQIDAELRVQVLRDYRSGSLVDPRRLQALVADL